MAIRFFGFLCLLFGPVIALGAEIMFEGYYRIDLENKQVGYSILRFSFDAKTNTFSTASFLRAKFGEKIVQESLKAKVSDKFRPISYNYTSQVGSDLKMIDATFNGDTMKLKIKDGKKPRDETYQIPKGTFLSSFLPYLLLQQKLTLNEAFKYSAVAEEEGNSYWGKAWLQVKENKLGYELFTISNRFKDEEFISKMAVVKDPKNPDKNIKGEVFITNSDSKNLTIRLMASPNLATEGQLIPHKILVTVFDGIPAGKINMVSVPPGPAPTPAPVAAPAKPDTPGS